ncbi:MAG: energy-coupling factor transporter transmembrane protein EcfT [Bacillales bacterium]|nr:energy-coupling factor transporter transmembrane protein EcfT [Bacillales bacterium]
MKKGIHSFHPFVCFLYFAGAMAAVMLYQHPVFLAAGAVLFLLLNILLDSGKTVRKWRGMMITIPVFFLILNPLTNHRGSHIFFYFGANPVTLESFLQGLMLSLTLFNLMAAFAAYNQVITAEKFLFLFAKWLPQWALLAMLAMRFFPLLRRRLHEIEMVQRGKGRSVTEGTFPQRVRNGLEFVQILLTWSLEEAIQTADSMAARGYGIQKRSRYIPFRMQGKDWLAIVYLLVFGTAVAFGWWLGDGVLAVYPILETLLLQGREWVFLLVFVMFVGFPIAIQVREALLWHYWKRKI